jgi:TolA-binding protein
MAQAHGTTLEKALDSYTGIETLLRKNVVAGLDQIVNNLGLKDPQTGQPIGLRDISYHVLSQSPEQLQQVQMGNQQMAATHQLVAANQRIERLENEHRQMQYAQQFHYTRSAVDQFAEQHPRIDEKEFGEVVKQEVELGFPLAVAYQRAERLLPATHAAQTGTTPAQTRPPDRSIHGSPDVAPSNGASRKPKQPSKSPAEAVQNALKRMNGHA